jgi:hypothetical protein
LPYRKHLVEFWNDHVFQKSIHQRTQQGHGGGRQHTHVGTVDDQMDLNNGDAWFDVIAGTGWIVGKIQPARGIDRQHH